MLKLSLEWAKELVWMPETGMRYQVVSVVLKDRRRFDQAVVVGGYITQIKGHDDMPFSEDDIAQLIVTHDKWDFAAGQQEG